MTPGGLLPARKRRLPRLTPRQLLAMCGTCRTMRVGTQWRCWCCRSSMTLSNACERSSEATANAGGGSHSLVAAGRVEARTGTAGATRVCALYMWSGAHLALGIPKVTSITALSRRGHLDRSGGALGRGGGGRFKFQSHLLIIIQDSSRSVQLYGLLYIQRSRRLQSPAARPNSGPLGATWELDTVLVDECTRTRIRMACTYGFTVKR